VARNNFDDLSVWHNKKPFPQDAQKGRPAKEDCYLVFLVCLVCLVKQDQQDEQDGLADFFSILPDQLNSREDLWLTFLMSMPINFSSTLGRLDAR
jgi:hypothetical protein